MIRLVLEFIDRKLKKYDNEVTRAILCILKCFFWCLEKVLKFISTNAYIMCAIHGKNFCSSAKHSFSLLFRNMIRFVILDKVSWRYPHVVFWSKICLISGYRFPVLCQYPADQHRTRCSGLYFLCDRLDSFGQFQFELRGSTHCADCIVHLLHLENIFPRVQHGRGHVILMFLWVIWIIYSSNINKFFFGSIKEFLRKYKTKWILNSFVAVEDCERNDGSPDKPYYMSKDLMKIFGKKNKKE